MLPAGVAQGFADLRRVGQGRLHLFALHVEDAQRRRRPLLPRLVVEHVFVFVQPGVEPLEVGRPAVAIADRVQLQPVVRHAEPPKQFVVELDQLGVDGGVVRADRFDGRLVVLAEAAFLRRRVAVHRRNREQLLRLRLAVEAVLEVGADDRRRCLRAERQRTAPAVLERVHLLLNDIRTRAGRAREELGLLEDRRLDAPVAVERAEALDLVRDPLPEGLFGRQDVMRPPRRLELGAHVARSSARNGLAASSAPSVVSGPWPE